MATPTPDLSEVDRSISRFAALSSTQVADADDARQETWLVLLREDLITRPTRGFGGVTLNFVWGRYRSESRRRRREQSVARVERISAPDPYEALEREETRREVLLVVSDLPDPYRSVIRSRYLDGQSLQEIADSEGLPLSTVKTRLRRGLARLRSRLESSSSAVQRSFVLGPAAIGAGAKLSSASAAGVACKGVVMSSSAFVSSAVAIVLIAGVLGFAWNLSSDVEDPAASVREVPAPSVSDGPSGLESKESGDLSGSVPNGAGSEESVVSRSSEASGKSGVPAEGDEERPAEDVDAKSRVASPQALTTRRAFEALRRSFGDGGGRGWKQVREDIAELQSALLSSDQGFEEFLALLDDEKDAHLLEVILHHLPLAPTEHRPAILKNEDLHDELWARYEEEEGDYRRRAFLRFFSYQKDLATARMGDFATASLEDPSPLVRQMGVDALSSRPELVDETLGTLVEVYEKDSDDECRKTALIGIGFSKSERAVGIVRAAFSSGDESVRAQAMNSHAGTQLLDEVSGGDALGFLSREFQSAKTKQYKTAVAERLTQNDPDRAEALLRKSLKTEKDWSVKREYRRLLQSLEDSRRERSSDTGLESR
ncbi:MAG: sigma-70 family RNA polymerase sigma factor [Planctomycetota bacterium]